MNAGFRTRLDAGFARLRPLVAVLVLTALFVLPGCGNDEDAQREADAVVYHAETTAPPTSAGSTDPVTVEPASSEPLGYADAEALYHQGRYNEAADAFRTYTEQHPDNVWGHYMLGLAHWKAGRSLEAEEALVRALTIDPSHLKARQNLARVLLDDGRPGEALPEARRVAELAPESAEAQRVLGRAFQNLNRHEEAVEAYERAIRLDPRDVWAMNNLALIYIQQERFEEALPPLARATRLRADLAVIQNNLGVALERTGRFTSAGAAYRAALAANPEHRRASESLARIQGLRDETGFGEPELAELAALFAEKIDRPREEKKGDETAALEEPRTP
jgi:tetratricopeptide (TPR) repeat protein